MQLFSFNAEQMLQGRALFLCEQAVVQSAKITVPRRTLARGKKLSLYH